jgi:hypothetical protein
MTDDVSSVTDHQHHSDVEHMGHPADAIMAATWVGKAHRTLKQAIAPVEKMIRDGWIHSREEAKRLACERCSPQQRRRFDAWLLGECGNMAPCDLDRAARRAVGRRIPTARLSIP